MPVIDLEAAPHVTFTEEWCLEMARKEGDSDVTAGVPELESARKLAERYLAVAETFLRANTDDADLRLNATAIANVADLVLSLIREAERARSLTPEVREGLRILADPPGRNWNRMNPSLKAALAWIEEHVGESK